MGAKSIKVSWRPSQAARKSPRTEHYHEAPFRCQTLRADIDYGLLKLRPPAASGIKLWIYKGRGSPAVASVAPLKLRSRHSSAAIVAVTVAAVVTSTVASVVRPVRKEATVNAALRGVRHRRVHRGRMTSKATRPVTSYRTVSSVSRLPSRAGSPRIRSRALRIAMTRYTKRGGQVWIKIFPDKPVTSIRLVLEWVPVRAHPSTGLQ